MYNNVEVPAEVMLRAVQILCRARGKSTILILAHSADLALPYTVDTATHCPQGFLVGAFNWDAKIKDVYTAIQKCADNFTMEIAMRKNMVVLTEVVQ